MKKIDLTQPNKTRYFDKPHVLVPRVNNADGDSSNSGENFLKNVLNTFSPGGGIKTDVSITLAPSNFIYMGIAIFVAVGAVLLVNKLLSETVFKS